MKLIIGEKNMNPESLFFTFGVHVIFTDPTVVL